MQCRDKAELTTQQTRNNVQELTCHPARPVSISVQKRFAKDLVVNFCESFIFLENLMNLLPNIVFKWCTFDRGFTRYLCVSLCNL